MLYKFIKFIHKCAGKIINFGLGHVEMDLHLKSLRQTNSWDMFPVNSEKMFGVVKCINYIDSRE